MNKNSNLNFFLLGLLLLGINQGILNATFNNYLFDIFSISATARGVIEFPRELPGFLSIVVTGILTIWSVRRWAILVGILSAVGIAGLGLLSPTVSVMIFWMFLWSLADHLFMSVESIMGLKLAPKNGEGKVLGKISGIRNLAFIFGSFLVFLLMGKLSWNYKHTYLVAITTAGLAAVAFYFMHLKNEEIAPKKFVVKKAYTLFYILNLLFGARKQIFLTFAPWVLVSIYHSTADTMAILFVISSLLGFIFRQYFGILVDRFGERPMLLADAIIFFVICIGFAFFKNIYLLYALFIIDGLMFATRIARTTYLHKITTDRRDIAPTISLGISIDHAVSMLIPFIGGVIWQQLDYKYVFILASLLAFINLFAALKIPAKELTSSTTN
ncbi:MAG: MFS transporter [Oligoflexia bacterium]|nr:MFS transporter [Oligoflexia bacterium]MBF0366389.1 MFS transporter [Oligoflexia bacterium]